ncbi:chitin synthase-domain-containing protein [Blyttiomyces helicus]|uniref:chitin synthase n=1 Tax=Blyttiomyces helicus TaxID=388810 RepID=A0A4P9WP33_9FUNG|nr:chitin synthase-domain-containing protein [Blyttiomyces helicus]|eukprot:RKO94774.1 chitin synthase-domain-containing protein [Blyttiomyces helicus]
MVRPDRARSPSAKSFLVTKRRRKCCNPWHAFTWSVTWCCLPVFLSKCGGMHDKAVQQAWREKVALCTIVAFMCGFLAFITYGFVKIACNSNPSTTVSAVDIPTWSPSDPTVSHHFIVQGNVIDMSRINAATGLDISPYFAQYPLLPAICAPYEVSRPTDTCSTSDFSPIVHCHDATSVNNWLSTYQLLVGPVVYDWGQVEAINSTLVVYKESVLDVGGFLKKNETFLGPLPLELLSQHLQEDVSKPFSGSSDLRATGDCLTQLYKVGTIAAVTTGCIATNTLLYISLVIILGVVLSKFALAVYFDWFISHELGKLMEMAERDANAPSRREMVEGGGDHPFPLKAGAMNRASELMRVKSLNPNSLDRRKSTRQAQRANSRRRPVAEAGGGAKSVYESPYGKEVYTLMLVTCYSEGEEGLRTTMDSLADTSYSDDRKLLFVVADGIITGHGETQSTPDIVTGMVEMDKNWTSPPPPMSYIAIADGSKRHNMAQVYCAWYPYKDRCVPTIIVVKCGTPAEAKGGKPGNRGKRDSQIILMNFFQRVTFDNPMTPLDFDLFQKMHYLMGVTPDNFEIVLMVDADTKVAPDSLSRMVACMVRDPLVMGLCGETRIANKSESWVSRIQVFEYYLSHHLAKAFESIFGGVTCLPGCFCMYRLKAPKDGNWVPILANEDIVRMYSENVVDTLHKKNLLLLGEDRFLTTLMLGTFTNRKLIFVPRAFCKTVVPAEFKVLLSQRRRWINSTIHNLMELVLVRELCGIFCFSMQFIIMLELIGTCTLPAAIVFTIYLIIISIVGTPQIVPLLLLGAIIGLPAILILLTTRRRIYVYWMLVYLLALPVWNFVLPVYAFWHFDDFSWGQTRKVEGEDDKGHGESDGKVMRADEVVFRRWVDWETERRRNVAREWLREKTALRSKTEENDITESESAGLTVPKRTNKGEEPVFIIDESG